MRQQNIMHNTEYMLTVQMKRNLKNRETKIGVEFKWQTGQTYVEFVGHGLKVDGGGRDSFHIRHVAMGKASEREGER